MRKSLSLLAAAAVLSTAGIAAVLKAWAKTNEIITTLMLNYVAIQLFNHLVYGPWRDPSSLGFPMTAPFPDAARLPVFGEPGS